MTSKNNIFIALILLVAASSCTKLLPRDKDSFSSDSRFTQDVYSPTLGQVTVFNTFNAGNSTQPLTFKIVNPRTRDGAAAQELLDVFPVKVWKHPYTGEEKSLKEIEDKRVIENHRIFEIREHSGQFIMWPMGNSNFIRTRPDSGYIFDVEVSNSGGRKYFRDMKLMPYRERRFEPNPADPVTGQGTTIGGFPSSMTNVYQHRSGGGISFPMSPYDVSIFFYRVGDGNSLTFKFLDTLQNPINPDMFRLTDWQHFVHGFNMQKTATEVKYEVGYPIPLTALPTPYTNANGQRAVAKLKWDRVAFGGLTLVAQIDLGFAIFEQGDWEIYVWFRNANPKFIND